MQQLALTKREMKVLDTTMCDRLFWANRTPHTKDEVSVLKRIRRKVAEAMKAKE